MANQKDVPELGLDDKNIQRNQGAPTSTDVEKQQHQEEVEHKKSVYAGLGWLDRLLVLWILLAIVVGILLGNFVDSVGPALQKGKFVNVSVPIGTSSTRPMSFFVSNLLTGNVCCEQLWVSW